MTDSPRQPSSRSLASDRPIALLLRVPPPYGGGEILNVLLQERLAGEPVYVVAAHTNPQGSKSNQGQLTWVNLRFACQRIWEAWRLIRTRRPSVIYFSIPKNFAAFLWTAAVALPAAWAGVKVCGELAGMRFEFFDSRWKRAVGLAVLRRFHSIRYLGRGIQDAHARYQLRNPVVFPNGIEAPASELRTEAFARETPLQLLYVGSLEESKGVGILLEAAALARARGLSVRWTLVGEWGSSAFRVRAEKMIRDHDLRDTVVLAGLVTGDARWAYFRRAHILVHPTRLDGQPLTILEAMSQGLAVISTPVGAIPETVTTGRNGVLLDETTPERLLAAVGSFLFDRDALLRVMQTNREDFRARYTADVYVGAFRGWLESVRAGTAPAPVAAESAGVRGRILLVLRVPPPYGGGEIRAEAMARHVGANPRYIVSAMKNPGGTKANQGRLQAGNVVFALRRILIAWRLMILHRPAVLLLAIPKNFAAFLWTAVMSLPASWVGIRVCGGLAGMRFEFFHTRWKKAVACAVLRRFHSIRFLGHGIRKAHENLGLRNAVVFPNGVEAPPAEPRTEAVARGLPLRLLYVGSLEESKGVGIILQTAAAGRAKGLPLQWTLVGEWASRAFQIAAEQVIREQALQDVVAITGLIPGNERWAYYRQAHVLVHPTRLDGQPLVILEAMSQGLAVISTPIGAIPETIASGRNGVLLVECTPGRALESIEGFLADRDNLLRVMRTNREDFLVRFTSARYLANNCSWLEAAADDTLATWTPSMPVATTPGPMPSEDAG